MSEMFNSYTILMGVFLGMLITIIVLARLYFLELKNEGSFYSAYSAGSCGNSLNWNYA